MRRLPDPWNDDEDYERWDLAAFREPTPMKRYDDERDSEQYEFEFDDDGYDDYLFWVK